MIDWYAQLSPADQFGYAGLFCFAIAIVIVTAATFWHVKSGKDAIAFGIPAGLVFFLGIALLTLAGSAASNTREASQFTEVVTTDGGVLYCNRAEPQVCYSADPTEVTAP